MKHIKCALSALFLTLSRAISQCASFVQYICNQKDGKDPPLILPREGVVTTEQLTANERGTEVLKNQKKKNKRVRFAPFKRVCILLLCTKFNIFVT